MPFPPFAACRFFDLPPVNLQNLPLHLTKNAFASAPTHLCGIALATRQESPLLSLRHRLVSSLCGESRGTFASAEARRWTEPVWQRFRSPPPPLRLAHLVTWFVTQRWQVAAALSAAVTTTKPIRDTPTSQAEPTPEERSHPKRQPLFGRGGLGERRFSQRSGLSPRISPTSVSSGGSAREGSFS